MCIAATTMSLQLYVCIGAFGDCEWHLYDAAATNVYRCNYYVAEQLCVCIGALEDREWHLYDPAATSARADFFEVPYIHENMKRDLYIWKETYIYEKRSLYMKRDVYIWRETCAYDAATAAARADFFHVPWIYEHMKRNYIFIYIFMNIYKMTLLQLPLVPSSLYSRKVAGLIWVRFAFSSVAW